MFGFLIMGFGAILTLIGIIIFVGLLFIISFGGNEEA